MSLSLRLCRRGYDIVPVNPAAPSINGHRCFARVQDIAPPVRAALLMTSPEVTEKVVADCFAAGIKQVWMYRSGGEGAVSPKALEFCKAKGMEVIPDSAHSFFFRVQRGFTDRMVLSGRLPGATRGTVLRPRCYCENTSPHPVDC